MAEPLKNLFNPVLVRNMAGHLARVGPFAAQTFTEKALEGIEGRELMQRADQIAAALEAHLPADFPHACAMLRAALHPGAVAEDWQARPDDEAGIRGWAIVPMGSFVARRGMDHIDLSLDTLRDFTSRLTSEFALRPFYMAEPARTLTHVERWVHDPDPHVRRLASEGTRPRLPWGIRLKSLVADPAPILPVLHALRDDPSDYVRRSVANALNDISRDHPELVAGIVADWLPGASPARAALLHHAARSLVKAGHPEVLASFGFGAPDLAAVTFRLTPEAVRMGDTLDLSLALNAGGDTAQNVLVDYVMHFRRANGSLGHKVFKWTKAVLEPGQEVNLRKRHALRVVTTRRHYPGAHRVSVQVNGAVVADGVFELIE